MQIKILIKSKIAAAHGIILMLSIIKLYKFNDWKTLKKVTDTKDILWKFWLSYLSAFRMQI